MILNAVETGQGPVLVLLHGLFGAARNFGAVQKQLSARFRTIALDLRNHGASPHDAQMSYPAMAADVTETLRARDALPAMVVGHSMGGKVAMEMALSSPGDVARLAVADIAPVRYRPTLRVYLHAMQALPLLPGLTRAKADAALAEAVPDAGIRAFLLSSLQSGSHPTWRLGLEEIAAAMPEIEDWPEKASGTQYAGPTLFIAGEHSDYIRDQDRPAIRALFPAARFARIKNAGHWVHAENPAGFVAVVEAFCG
jgi:pimeloyl-ACP methyl ester carboxylesterase